MNARAPVVLLGLVASSAVALGAVLTGRLVHTPSAHVLVVLQHWALARPLGRTLLFSGIATLCVAWWWLGRVVRRDGVGVRTVASATAVWAGPLAITPPAFSGDVWSYVANGVLIKMGMSPYVFTPAFLPNPLLQAVSARWRDSPAPYGPVAVAFGGLTTEVTSSPWLLMLAYRLLALAGLALLGWAVTRIARSLGRDPALALWIAVASPFTLVQGVAGAHLDLAVAGLVGLATVLAIRRRAGWAAVVVGVAAAVKVSAMAAVVPVVLVLLAGTGASRLGVRVRTALYVGGVAVLTLLALGVVTGLGTGWVHGLTAPLSGRSPLSPSTQLGLQLSHLMRRDLLHPVQLAGEVLLVLVAALVLLRARVDDAGSAVRSGAVVLVAAVVLSPVVHPWYLCAALPLVACSVTTAAGRRTATVVAAGLAVVAPLDASQHLPGAALLMKLGVVAAVLAGLVATWEQDRAGSRPRGRW